MLGPGPNPSGWRSQAHRIDTVRQTICPLSIVEEVSVSNVDHLNAATGHLRAVEVAGLAAADIARTLAAVQEVSRIAQAITLDLAAAADAGDVARSQGAASTQAWLAQTGGISHRDAFRDLKLAKDLQSVAPQTRQAMSLPGMSIDKAQVITGAMAKLPRQLDDSQRTTVEADLVQRAQKHSIEDLRRAAKRAVEVIDATWADQLESA